jgi:hypothetical protein
MLIFQLTSTMCNLDVVFILPGMAGVAGGLLLPLLSGYRPLVWNVSLIAGVKSLKVI